MKEAFKMNLQSFSLVRIKSAIGVVSIDGKCKFLDMGTLETLLNLILKMIESLALPAPAASPWFIPSIDVDDSNQPIESIEL